MTRRTLATIAKITLAAIVIGCLAAWLWVPLLREMPEPLPDRLRWGSGGFGNRCQEDPREPGRFICRAEGKGKQKGINESKFK
jgi:hypothetical protein